MDRLMTWLEELRYAATMNGVRCFLRLHHPDLWADYGYSFDEPNEAYWHCARCGRDCYPKRWQLQTWFWDLPPCRRYTEWEMKRDEEKERR